MKKTILKIFIISISVMACSNPADTTTTISYEQSLAWFGEAEWRKGITALPDSSINIAAFHQHYSEHQGIWEQVFDFLGTRDLEALETGKYPLRGDSLFAIVDEYVTEDLEDRRFESHRKYIDLQYLIRGEELIGISSPDGLSLIEAYDPMKDIAFYETTDGSYRLADMHVFFIFFPDDAHQPCVKVGQASAVKKIVFKILVA